MDYNSERTILDAYEANADGKLSEAIRLTLELIARLNGKKINYVGGWTRPYALEDIEEIEDIDESK